MTSRTATPSKPSAFSTEPQTVLVADDEHNLRRVLRAQLLRDGFEVIDVGDGEAALVALEEHHVDVLITDLRMPKRDGMSLLRETTSHYPHVPVIMITAHGTVDTAVEALKVGAFDYVTKPFDRDELRHAVRKATKTRQLQNTDLDLDQSERGRYQIIGQSAPMREVYDLIERVANTPSTVLISGESGTGKELIAQALHENGDRQDKPFIRVSCAAIPPELIESELFGYEKGAFTGAVSSKPGRFELASGGSLFLDEIGEIPVSMQVKLLRAIQTQEFERVGGIKTIKTDIRLIAATNRDLREEIEEGRFREDLFYRLNVVEVVLPPLRDRTSDIPLLLHHFIAKFNERLNRHIEGYTESAGELLLAHRWRGNIRELENLVERCMLFCDETHIDIPHLPAEFRNDRSDGRDQIPLAAQLDASGTEIPEGGLKDAVRQASAALESSLIQKALSRTGGNVTHAARLLKISRKSLQTKMKEFGLR